MKNVTTSKGVSISVSDSPNGINVLVGAEQEEQSSVNFRTELTVTDEEFADLLHDAIFPLGYEDGSHVPAYKIRQREEVGV